MPTIVPPTSGNYSALLKGVSPNQNPGSATQVPPGIISLPSGTILHGDITKIDGRGNAILNTSQGQVSLQTDLAIKLGSEVVLRLTTSSKGIKARILSVNGLNPQEFANKSASPRGQQIQVDDIVQTSKQNNVNKPVLDKQQIPIRSDISANNVNLKPTAAATALRGVLLSRADSIPQVLNSLPSSINIPTQRLESGTIISVKILPQTIQLPQAQPNITTQQQAISNNIQGQTNSPSPTTNVATTTSPTSQSAIQQTNTVSPTQQTTKTANTSATQSTPTTNTPQNTATPSVSTTQSQTTNSSNNTAQITNNTGATPNNPNAATTNNTAQNQTTNIATGSQQSTSNSGLPTATSANTTQQTNPTNATSTTTGNTSNLQTNTISQNNPTQSNIVTNNQNSATTPNIAQPQIPGGTTQTVATTNNLTQQNNPTQPAGVTNTSTTQNSATISGQTNTQTSTVNTNNPNIAASNQTTATARTDQNTSPAANNQTTSNTPNATPSATNTTNITNNPNTATIQTSTQSVEQNITSLLSQGQLPAQVIGNNQSGETVVKTALGVIKISIPASAGVPTNLQIGTNFNLQIDTINLPQNLGSNIAAQISSAPATLSQLSMQWSSLQETVELLAQVQPAMAAQILDAVIPKPGAKMAAQTLFFLSALRGGDINKWLGNKTLEILEQNNRSDLIRKLTAEFGTLRQFFVDSPSPNWQAAFLPVYDNGEWQQARMFLKKEPENENNEAGGVRFIMEIDLSNMGPMQFDGLIRKKGATSSFDLIIRSQNALSSNDRQNIRDIYQSSSDITGYTGGVSFQVSTPFPILPMKDILADAPDIMA